MESWFTEPKIPLGRWVKIGITWLQDNAAGFFDTVTAIIDFLVDGCTAILLHIPFLVVVFALAALGLLDASILAARRFRRHRLHLHR